MSNSADLVASLTAVPPRHQGSGDEKLAHRLVLSLQDDAACRDAGDGIMGRGHLLGHFHILPRHRTGVAHVLLLRLQAGLPRPRDVRSRGRIRSAPERLHVTHRVHVVRFRGQGLLYTGGHIDEEAEG